MPKGIGYRGIRRVDEAVDKATGRKRKRRNGPTDAEMDKVFANPVDKTKYVGDVSKPVTGQTIKPRKGFSILQKQKNIAASGGGEIRKAAQKAKAAGRRFALRYAPKKKTDRGKPRGLTSR